MSETCSGCEQKIHTGVSEESESECFFFILVSALQAFILAQDLRQVVLHLMAQGSSVAGDKNSVFKPPFQRQTSALG